jgi:hypothetical protein
MALSTALAAGGCTTGKPDRAALDSSSAGAAPSGTTAPETPAAQPPPAGTGVSPAGVTTSVNAMPSSLEEEYYQACRAAADWIAGKQGDRGQLVEQYLGYVQRAPAAAGVGTFHKSWADLSPDRQAAVIVATNAAADHQC